MSALQSAVLASLLSGSMADAPATRVAEPCEQCDSDEHLLSTLVGDTRNLLVSNGFLAKVTARVKSPESARDKMRRKGHIADRIGLRVHVATEAECYAVRDLLQAHYAVVAGTDYIANPKPNGYQSLHTVVRTRSTVVEFQVRTHGMHEVAEHGSAAHWRYKAALAA